MKAFAVSFLILVSSFASFPQTTVRDEKEPIEVLRFDWKYAGYSNIEMDDKKRDSVTPGGMSTRRVKGYAFKYTATATIKNRGAKKIKAIEWDYVFTNPESQKEIKRFKIKSKQMVGPDEIVTLSKTVVLDTSQEMQPVNNAKQKVFITRLEYEDGSVWHL